MKFEHPLWESSNRQSPTPRSLMQQEIKFQSPDSDRSQIEKISPVKSSLSSDRRAKRNKVNNSVIVSTEPQQPSWRSSLALNKLNWRNMLASSLSQKPSTSTNKLQSFENKINVGTRYDENWDLTGVNILAEPPEVLPEIVQSTRPSLVSVTLPQAKCDKEAMLVDFEDLGFSSWIMEPKSFPSSSCSGICAFPTSQVI